MLQSVKGAKSWKDRRVSGDVVSEELQGYHFKNVDLFKKKLNSRRKKKYQRELERVIKAIEAGELTYRGKRGKDIFFTFYKIGKQKMVVFN